MELVKSYDIFLNKLMMKYDDEERIVCLFFIDPFNDDTMSGYVSRRFDYLHCRTGKHVDFFCPGYNNDSENRSFDTKDYVAFINQLEELTNWKYNGGTNLLLLRYKNCDLQFDSVYDFNFTRMIIDGIIKDHRLFIEDIIYHLKTDIENYLDEQWDKKQLNSLWDNFSELLPRFATSIIRQIRDTQKVNKYFSPHSIKK